MMHAALVELVGTRNESLVSMVPGQSRRSPRSHGRKAPVDDGFTHVANDWLSV